MVLKLGSAVGTREGTEIFFGGIRDLRGLP